MLQPVVRRTWAPRGQTPIQYSWDRRDRLSVISAITVLPQFRRLGLYFNVFDHNIVTGQFSRLDALPRTRYLSFAPDHGGEGRQRHCG